MHACVAMPTITPIPIVPDTWHTSLHMTQAKALAELQAAGNVAVAARGAATPGLAAAAGKATSSMQGGSLAQRVKGNSASTGRYGSGIRALQPGMPEGGLGTFSAGAGAAAEGAAAGGAAAAAKGPATAVGGVPAAPGEPGQHTRTRATAAGYRHAQESVAEEDEQEEDDEEQWTDSNTDTSLESSGEG